GVEVDHHLRPGPDGRGGARVAGGGGSPRLIVAQDRGGGRGDGGGQGGGGGQRVGGGQGRRGAVVDDDEVQSAGEFRLERLRERGDPGGVVTDGDHHRDGRQRT